MGFLPVILMGAYTFVYKTHNALQFYGKYTVLANTDTIHGSQCVVRRKKRSE
jgi:hypothetical protein